jgi:hypothetical protein
LSLKHEEVTAETDEDRKNDSIVRLINSEQLTVEMAVNYLYSYRKNLKITSLLLERLKHFCLTKSSSCIPAIMYTSPHSDSS